MERWNGRVALVTGASAGIGESIVKILVKNGLKVVGAARSAERIQKIGEELQGEKGSLLAVKCDLTKDEDIYALFQTIKETYGGVDICVNNAGITFSKSLLDGTPDQWRQITDVNVIALCLCSKLTVASMRERGIDDGHIINVSSIAAYEVLPGIPEAHFYCGTKFAVRAISEGLRHELRDASTRIRVSCISPGVVKTEIVARAHESEELSEIFYKATPYLLAEDVASSVLHIIAAPPHVEINELILIPAMQGGSPKEIFSAKALKK